MGHTTRIILFLLLTLIFSICLSCSSWTREGGQQFEKVRSGGRVEESQRQRIEIGNQFDALQATD